MTRIAFYAMALAAAQSFATGAGAADSLLKNLAGEWTGRGQARENAGAKMEFILCTVSNRLSGDGDTLSQSGKCSIGSNTFSIGTTISADGNGRYSALINPPNSAGPVTLSGRRSGDSLTMAAEFPNAQNGLTMQTRITIDMSGSSSYRISTTASDPTNGRPYQAGSISFSRRK